MDNEEGTSPPASGGPSTKSVLLTQAQTSNSQWHKQNAGYSGTPMWKIAADRERAQAALEAQGGGDAHGESVPTICLQGYEKLTDDWWWNEKLQRGYQLSTDQFFKVNPITKEYLPVHVSEPSGITFHVDSTFMQGRRPKQEDRHVMIKDLQLVGEKLKMPLDHLDTPAALFSVFDGHQGTACAEYCAKNFHMKLLPKLSANPGMWTDEMVKAAFTAAFAELDEDFLNKHRGIPDGCTAVIALLLGTRLFLAWVGDSRCVMMLADGKALPLTRDHKPEQEEERVEKAGGNVIKLGGCYRVAAADFDEKYKKIRQAKAQGLGTIAKDPVALAVSRSFGDREFKIPAPLLTAVPDVEILHLNPVTHKGIMLLCDGVFDVMNNDEVTAIMARNVGRPRAACGDVVNEAFTRGSEDNLTAICVFFEFPAGNEGDKSGKEGAKITGFGGDSTPDQKRRKLDHGHHFGSSGHTLDSIRCRHILVKHCKVRNPIDKVRANKPVTLTEAEAEQQIREILRKLSDTGGDKEKFAEVFNTQCREHSMCTSALKGGNHAGDLGWFKANKMQKAFSTPAFALKVGQLSDIVSTDSGIHIIWRTA